MKFTSTLFGIIAALSLAGCVSVSTNMTLNRLDIPEAGGVANRAGLGLGVGGLASATYTGDASSRPLNIQNPPSFKQGQELIGRFRYGIWNFLDLYVRGDFASFSPFRAGAKLQILGEPSSVAKKGNFSLAATGASIFGYRYLSGTQNGTFGPGGYPWNSDLNVTGQDFAAIVGFRATDSAVLYGGAFQSGYYSSGSIHQAQSDNGLSPAAQATFSGSGSVQGTDLGLALTSGHAVFAFELSWSTVQWNINGAATNVMSPTAFGASVDVRF